MILLVCGGRDYDDTDFLEKFLDDLAEKHRITLLIHGGARGADELASNWAWSRDIPRKEYKAYWNKHGNAAGPIRNKLMLTEGKPDLVIAFPGGSGTADCIRQAKLLGIKVIEYNL